MVRRLAIVCTALAVIFATSMGGLWWRLGTGPINLDIASPWLAAALEDNIGHGDTVEVGGTQIERAGRFRIAVPIRDIIVRDRDHAIIASAPKAEARLSGSALLLGRLHAESLTLVDAEIAVRITPEGYVTVSAGDHARPLPDTLPRQTPPNASTRLNQPAVDNRQSGLLAALDWLDSLSPTGLDGQKLSEIGFENGSLIFDDQERGKKSKFLNISFSLRRPSGGGVEFSLGEEGTQPWSVLITVGPGPLNVRDFIVKGGASLDMLAANSPAGAQSGIGFSRLRAEFIWQNGQLTIRDGILQGPHLGGTIEGDIDYPGNQVRIRGTFVPLDGLNNMFGQVPVHGGGSNEGLFGVTYELAGTPGQPVFRVNPISAMAPGVLRKIFEVKKNPNDFPPKN